ncbi:MAG: response regulator transcription factor [Arenibacterium sp.]
MYTKISELSDFVLSLHGQARALSASELVASAVSDLSDVLGFDSAWYGWAQLDPCETVIHANSTYNLPQSYFEAWQGMADQDVLVEQFLEDPASVPIYDRSGAAQTDGMEYLADSFGLKKMATAMCLRHDRTASFFLSAYRGGRSAAPWRKGEREFLQCAVDNISQAARLAASQELHQSADQTASAFVSRRGNVIVGLADLRERFGHLWSKRDGDQVPHWLMDYAQAPGEHMLPDQGLMIRCETSAPGTGLEWHKLTLRPLEKFDFLSAREKEVAFALANGNSHKMVAKLLGVAPATVRNQTQSIYRKLGVDNRAALTQHLSKGVL